MLKETAPFRQEMPPAPLRSLAILFACISWMSAQGGFI